VGDSRGHCAAIAFVRGEVVVNEGPTMPVPALFNTPYDRELEILKYYKGFRGLYDPALDDYRVPRFVKTAVMLRDYEPTKNIVDYGFGILDSLTVFDVPEWSVVFDVREQNVYFKTRINPEIEHFSMNRSDFSSESPALILNMDTKDGGDVIHELHPYSNEEMGEFTRRFVFPILPEEFFTRRGLTLDEYLERTSTHSDAAASTDSQFFRGVWRNSPEGAEDRWQITLRLEPRGAAGFENDYGSHILLKGD